ncbi:MAG: apolipoprotein N-acyltransferase [Paracoccaceae bacterium]
MADNTRTISSWFFKNTGWLQSLASIVIGATIALGQAPYSLIWLSFPAICVAAYLGVGIVLPRRAAIQGFLVGIGFSVVTFNWIVEPFLVDIKTHGWLAPFALILMSAGIGAFWSGAFWATAKMASAGSFARVLAVPIFWTGAEMLRSYVLTGFPWGLTSYIWIDTPVYQIASVLGPHGMTLATVMLASLLVMSLKRSAYGQFVVGVFILLMAWAGGAVMLGQDASQADYQGPLVRLIQPNASQEQKWDPEMMPIFYNRQLMLTAQESETPIELVIWPEVAVPYLLSDPNSPLWEISGAANDVPVIIGAQRFVDGQAFNSLALLGPKGAVLQVYDKQHLVPFGEYLPGDALLNRLGLRALAAQFGTGYSAGSGPNILNVAGLGNFLPLICYEAIFPHELRQVDQRPDWMLMITNDAWFGNFVGPFQHLAQARARAIETGLPMVRAANTGVSAVIDARGRVTGSLPLGVAGHLDVRLPETLKATLYWRLGDKLALIMLFVLALITIVVRRNKSN